MAVEAELADPALVLAVEDQADLAHHPLFRALLPELAEDLAHLAQHPLLPALLQVVVVKAALAVVAHPLTRSFSAAMAGLLPSLGPPTYAAVPRSRRKPKRRPCPLA